MEAIEVARKLTPELVVLDLCMPGISGLETARRLQSTRPPPLVMLYSLSAEQVSAEEAFRNGIAEIVSKADGVRTLINKARGILHQSAA